MPFIATVTDAEAADAVAELFDADRARVGYVPNYTRLFAHRPAVYGAWRQLLGARGNREHGPAPVRARDDRRRPHAQVELLHARSRTGSSRRVRA